MTAVLLQLAAGRASGQAPTMVDQAYPAGNTVVPDGDVLTIVQDRDGGLLVGGQFSNFGAVPHPHLVRLQADGSVDAGFFASPGANNFVYAVAVQGNGRIVIGGSFTEVHGQSRSYLARLDTRGNLDPSFAMVDLNNEIRAIAVQPDGRILIAGRFTRVAGVARNRVARLNADGSLDALFDPGTGANDNVRTLQLQADGRILIGGQFTIYNGTNRSRIARLTANGALDLTFNPGGGADGQVRTMATAADLAIYIGGEFQSFDGTAISGLARLHPNGTLDAGFAPGTANGSVVRALYVQDNLKLWVGGAFYQAGGAAHANLARLNPDGSADEFFEPFPATDNEVFALVPDAAGGLVLGGDFNQVSDARRIRMARLRPDVRIFSYEFTPSLVAVDETAGVASLQVRRHGSIRLPSAVSIVTRDKGATAGLDYTALAGEVAFAAGQTTNAANVVILDDVRPEGQEWFDAELGLPPDETVGTNALCRVLIIDNEYQATVDESFDPTMLAGAVSATAVQPDGQIAIGGDFRHLGACVADYFSRLDSHGREDCGFIENLTGTDGPVRSLELMSGGRILAGGSFQTFVDNKSRYLARVLADGRSDPSFLIGTRLNGPVLATAVDANDQILVGGMFTAYGAASRPRLARLLTDGSLDVSFAPEVDGPVRAIRITGDGGIFVAGDFEHINGAPRPHVARLLHDGTVDPTFAPEAGPDRSVMAAVEQTDGKWLIGGEFTMVDGQRREAIARLAANGHLDPTFQAGSTGGGSGRVNAIRVQRDGKILFGGAFAFVGGTPQSCVARVHADGTLDSGFLPGAGANGEVRSLELFSDGRILVAGDFTEIGNVARRSIARLYPEPSLNRLELTVSTNRVSESVGSVGLRVRRVGPSDSTVSVDYTAIEETARFGSDLVERFGTLVFNALETIKTIEIPIINDSLPEGPEQFRVRLSNPGGGALLGTLAESMVEIVDNDRGFALTQSDLTVREGVAEVALTVARNADGPGVTSIEYVTADITAQAGSDYQETRGTLSFLPNDFEKRVTIPLFVNPEFEGPEAFRFILRNPSPGSALGLANVATISIEDQDSAFEFGYINVSTEGEGLVPCYVKRRGLLTQFATVRLRTDGGTATPGLDYVPVNTLLTFVPGEYFKEFFLTNFNDGLVEGDETIRLTLSEPTGLSIISQSETNMLILDNDRGVEFVAPEFFVNEFTFAARVVVRRGDDGTNDLVVHYATADETAGAGQDYVARDGTLLLRPGETNAVLEIPIRQDSDLEATESFRVLLTGPEPPAVLGPNAQARVSIIDDERAGHLDVSFQLNPDDLPNQGLGIYYSATRLAAYPGGRLMLGANRLGRDGSIDTAFDVDWGGRLFGTLPLVRPDGRIFVGGVASNGVTPSLLLRLLETNGTIAPDFSFPIFQGRVSSLAPDRDGRLIAGGDFEADPPAPTHRALLRVLTSGEIDPTFSPPEFLPQAAPYLPVATVTAVAIQPDGQILAAGLFATVGGNAYPGVVRLDGSGRIDPTFHAPTLSGDLPRPYGTYYQSMILQPDGRILLAGSFTNVGGMPAHNVVRLNPDGSVDQTFSSSLAPAQTVHALALQPNGSVLVAGGYYNLQLGTYRLVLERLDPTGHRDPLFEPPAMTAGLLHDVIVLPGGDIAVYGFLADPSGVIRTTVVRLGGDGLQLRASQTRANEVTLDLFNTIPGRMTFLESSGDLQHWETGGAEAATGAWQRWVLPANGARQFYRARQEDRP